MRLPQKGKDIDYEQTCRMVDLFLESGYNYFDTAHRYHEGLSEIALKKCLTSRYPREKYLLTDKLTHGIFEPSPEGVRKFFAAQLEACGVDYFDFYLMHAQTAKYYEDFKLARAYETVFELKSEGLIRHVGISFHDRAEVLDRILTEYPQIELVQIQFNYMDYDDPAIQGRLCYEVCQKHGKPVVVMEPVKGGSLANLPAEASQLLSSLGTGASNASYAIRYVAGFPQVIVTLSGMSTISQMQDNIRCMSDFQPLSEQEKEAIAKVRSIILGKDLIPCTACRYCTEGCPMSISIPDLFSDLNAKQLYSDWNSEWYYEIHTQTHGKASDCIACGRCEAVCPQGLPIIELLQKVSKSFD